MQIRILGHIISNLIIFCVIYCIVFFVIFVWLQWGCCQMFSWLFYSIDKFSNNNRTKDVYNHDVPAWHHWCVGWRSVLRPGSNAGPLTWASTSAAVVKKKLQPTVESTPQSYCPEFLILWQSDSQALTTRCWCCLCREGDVDGAATPVHGC